MNVVVTKARPEGGKAVCQANRQKTNIFLLRISELTEREHKVNFVLLEAAVGDTFACKHYVAIKDLSRLSSSQTSGYNGKKNFCLRCLNHFSKKEMLDKHLEYCKNHAAVKIKMPKKGIDSSVLELKNHKHSMRFPITVYAYFECFTKKIDTCQPNPEKKPQKAISED